VDTSFGIQSDAHFLKQRIARCAKTARNGQSRASLVFRDFVRQLEKLDAEPPKPARGARA
jgi:hypothetical protein